MVNSGLVAAHSCACLAQFLQRPTRLGALAWRRPSL